MNLLICVSIAFGLVGIILGTVVVRLAKLEKELDKVKRNVLVHDVILNQDEDPLKNWPKDNLA